MGKRLNAKLADKAFMQARAEHYGPEIIDRASRFLHWYRRMVIEGQITLTEWAKARKPTDDDYGLMMDIDALLKEVSWP
jgi:hypothetical protein